MRSILRAESDGGPAKAPMANVSTFVFMFSKIVVFIKADVFAMLRSSGAHQPCSSAALIQPAGNFLVTYCSLAGCSTSSGTKSSRGAERPATPRAGLLLVLEDLEQPARLQISRA